MIVLDANLLVALVSGDLRGGRVLQHFMDWLYEDVRLHAPVLAKYEIANALTRLIVGERFLRDDIEQALSDLAILPITYHDIDDVQRVTEIALALNRQNAYDAAYLALSERLEAELWTLDGPLFRNATGAGFLVRLVQ